MKILITGVKRGLGRHLALLARSLGHEVIGIVQCSSDPDLELLLEQGVLLLECDLSDKHSLMNLIKNRQLKLIEPDVLVLNASITENDYCGELDIDRFEKIVFTNFTSPIMLAAHLAERSIKKSIRIIAISSFSAIMATDPKRIAYPSSKAAISMAFSAFRLSEKDRGVEFITIEPKRFAESEGFGAISFERAAKLVLDAAVRKKVFANIRVPYGFWLLARLYSLLPSRIQRFLLTLKGRHR